jgi:phage repressor protein C with HTH and peptisase S24 domain
MGAGALRAEGSARDLGIRLGAVIERLGNERRAARAAAKSVKQLKRYISGESAAPFDVVARLAAAARVSLDWLATGEGEVELAREMVGDDARHSPLGRPSLLAQAGSALVPAGMIGVPLYLAPGTGREHAPGLEPTQMVAFREAWLNETFHVDPRNLAVMPAPGESMTPTIQAGELLLFDTSHRGRQPSEGIYVIQLKNAMLVKRLQPLPGEAVKVSSDNPSYESFNVRLAGNENFAILGRVVFVFHQV